MDSRALATLLLGLSLVLAGCFGASGTETGTPAGTTVPADTTAPPDTPTPTPTPGPFERVSPPGVDRSGVTDVEALLTAHTETLAGTSATVEQRFTLTVNGSGRNVSLRGKVTPDTERGWMRIELTDGVGTYYTVNGTTYYRERVNGSLRYGTTAAVSAVPKDPRFGAESRIRRAIEAADWEFVGTVQRDGRTLLAFEPTSVDPQNVNTSGDATVKADGRLLVDGRGVVHLVSVSTTVENDRGTVRYALSVQITDVGETTIEEPEWLDKAR